MNNAIHSRVALKCTVVVEKKEECVYNMIHFVFTLSENIIFCYCAILLNCMPFNVPLNCEFSL